ncbi:MAG: carbonate dehydratase [Burkholderiales bacterium]|nr:carbonate dehydratase [Burkholderiales bacterium]
MPKLIELLQKNRSWADRMTGRDPEFFQRLAHIQTPKYLWIGCSDSRVPASEIVDLPPGGVFVHRNVANVVVHTDLNCLSVLQYAVDVLKVGHIIVTGHYGCGGIAAADSNRKLGLIDNWLRHVQDVAQKHAALLPDIGDATARLDRLCELNVIEQVVNVCQTTVVQDGWARGQTIDVHGWVYAVQDGLLRDLEITVSGPQELVPQYQAVMKMLQNTDGGVLPAR